MTYVGSTTQQAGVRLEKENIRFYGADNNLTEITVRNTGTENTKIVRIYMGNTSTNMIPVYSNEDGELLKAGSASTIIITWPNDLANAWKSENTYWFTIVPSSGQALEKIPEQAP